LIFFLDLIFIDDHKKDLITCSLKHKISFYETAKKNLFRKKLKEYTSFDFYRKRGSEKETDANYSSRYLQLSIKEKSERKQQAMAFFESL
jgi:hypothetical protein